jgi:hypothetical protein
MLRVPASQAQQLAQEHTDRVSSGFMRILGTPIAIQPIQAIQHTRHRASVCSRLGHFLFWCWWLRGR